MTGLRDNLGMSQRVLTVLVDPRVKRHEIEVPNLFPASLVYLVVEAFVRPSKNASRGFRGAERFRASMNAQTSSRSRFSFSH